MENSTKSETSNLTKETIFQIDLSTGLQAAQVKPGDSFEVSPAIYNDATENMYVFIVVDQPTSNIDDINVTITGYAIGTEDVPADVDGAWAYCKNARQLE